jgi:hypothetical protein
MTEDFYQDLEGKGYEEDEVDFRKPPKDGDRVQGEIHPRLT